MKQLVLFLLMIYSDNIIAQIHFGSPSEADILTISSQMTGKANNYIKVLNLNNLDNQDIPLKSFYDNNPTIFPSVISPSEFNVFLSSFNFNNCSIISKRSLIKQGVIYFIEKKVAFELTNKYLTAGKFDLTKLEIEFFKKLTDKDLHFLISFVEIFERWENYNEHLKPSGFATITEDELDYLKNLVSHYLNKIVEQEFFMYSYVNSSNQIAKSLYLDHGNDFLLPINNNDRDMTGSFRVELTTDLLKMRVFNKRNKSDILSYQSLFFAGEGYTPFIRYNPENLLNNGTSVADLSKFFYGFNEKGQYNEAFLNDYLAPVSNIFQKSIDRPFASFQYLGRAKYRIPIHGLWRYVGELKLGFVGKDLGRNIQAAIHKDLNPSIRVLNWDKQIGFPSRLAFEVHIRRDRLIFAQGNRVKREKDVYFDVKNAKIYPWLNLYYLAEMNTGTVQDALSFGLGFSNRSFKKQSGQREIKFNSRLPLNNLYFNFETKLKLQIHNSLLQGLGWFGTFNNVAKSDVNPDSFVLNKKDINRIVWFNDLKITYRMNRVAINYTASVNSQEFSNKDYKDSGKSATDYLLSKFTINNTQKEFAELLIRSPEIGGKLDIPKVHFVGTVAINFFIH